MKLFTVIIPVYGIEKYIGETIESVLAQTYSNFELILVDDGSPDESIEICRQFDDPRITILQQANQGPAAARNLGIRHSHGDYIALLDGDDLWEIDKLEKQAAHLEHTPDVGVSFCRSRLIDEFGEPLGLYQISKLTDITELDLLCRTPIGNGSVPVFRREALEAIRYTNGAGEWCYFNPDRRLHPSEDVECWMRIALTTNWKIEGIPEALTLYRIISSSCSAQLGKKLQSWEQMLQEVEHYAPEAESWKAPAMAYQLRHLARRAVSLRDGKAAVELMHQALGAYKSILVEEPHRTVQTLGAAYLLRLLPSQFYQKFEAIAVHIAGSAQKQRLNNGVS